MRERGRRKGGIGRGERGRERRDREEGEREGRGDGANERECLYMKYAVDSTDVNVRAGSQDEPAAASSEHVRREIKREKNKYRHK